MTEISDEAYLKFSSGLSNFMLDKAFQRRFNTRKWEASLVKPRRSRGVTKSCFAERDEALWLENPKKLHKFRG